MKRRVVVPGETRPTPNCHFTFTRAQTQTHACTQTRTVSSHTLWVRGGVLCESVDTPRCGSSEVLVAAELWLHCLRHIYVVVKISLSPTRERLTHPIGKDWPMHSLLMVPAWRAMADLSAHGSCALSNCLCRVLHGFQNCCHL